MEKEIFDVKCEENKFGYFLTILPNNVKELNYDADIANYLNLLEEDYIKILKNYNADIKKYNDKYGKEMFFENINDCKKFIKEIIIPLLIKKSI